jgi:hypothetical protein
VSDVEYLAHFQNAIKTTFGLESKHFETVEVVDTNGGQVTWEGEVEVFSVTGHPAARRCYAWAEDIPTGTHFVVVLARPPIQTASDAVRAAIMTGAYGRQNN